MPPLACTRACWAAGRAVGVRPTAWRGHRATAPYSSAAGLLSSGAATWPASLRWPRRPGAVQPWPARGLPRPQDRLLATRGSAPPQNETTQPPTASTPPSASSLPSLASEARTESAIADARASRFLPKRSGPARYAYALEELQRHPDAPLAHREAGETFDDIKKDEGFAVGATILGVLTVLVLGYHAYDLLYVHDWYAGQLRSDRFRTFKVIDAVPVNHNTYIVSVQVKHPEAAAMHLMGREDEEARVRDDNDSASTKQSVPVPSYVLVRDNDCQIVREYTPITYETNHVDLLIKCYPEGSMSSKLTHLVSGDEIDLRGPELHPGFDLAGVKEIGMVAGGTGITPMYQLIKYILTQAPHAADTRLSLVYTNAYEVDILLRKELDLLQQHFPSRFKVTYVLDYPPSPQWPGWRGFVGQQVLQESLPSPLRDHEVKILVAGPDGLVKHVAGEKTTFQEQGPLRGLLARLGYHADQVYKF